MMILIKSFNLGGDVRTRRDRASGRRMFTFYFLLLQFKRKMNFIIFLIFLNVASFVECTNDYCSIDEKDSCKENQKSARNVADLDDKYAELLQKIHDAEASYVPCEAQKCGCFRGVITRDLKPFESGINLETIDTAKTRGTLYQLIDGKVYRDKECMFPSRCAGIEHFLLRVAKDFPSNVEFVVNTRDYPMSGIHFGKPLPVFSFSKTPEYYDVMYPAWSFWEGGPAISIYPRGLGRWDKHRKSLNESANLYPWAAKESKAFFRGSRTSTERDNLILLSRRRPDLVDAAYTKNQAWKSKEDTLDALPAPEVSLESHCRYKYLVNYRGVAASFRHKHLFLCRSLVLHVGHEWIEFYYESMKPWIHYVPVPKDASQKELEHLLNFARENDHLSRKIATRGRDFVWKRLRLKDVTCYWKNLLERYSKLLTYDPQLRSNFVHIS